MEICAMYLDVEDRVGIHLGKTITWFGTFSSIRYPSGNIEEAVL